jgi:hypothetical protein
VVDKFAEEDFSSGMKIVEYKTATAENCASLDALVNKLLAQGLQLHGSPYFTKDETGACQVAQALVRHGMREHPEPHEVIPHVVVAP